MMNVGFDSITSLERDFVCSSDGRRLVATGKLIFMMGIIIEVHQVPVIFAVHFCLFRFAVHFAFLGDFSLRRLS